jgi:outer membrane cobalamin receptor
MPRKVAAVTSGATMRVTLRGAAYQGFRAPTLNEFYRNFSSGNTQTRPNEALGPERLTGGDAGVLISRGRASVPDTRLRMRCLIRSRRSSFVLIRMITSLRSFRPSS